MWTKYTVHPYLQQSSRNYPGVKSFIYTFIILLKINYNFVTNFLILVSSLVLCMSLVTFYWPGIPRNIVVRGVGAVRYIFHHLYGSKWGFLIDLFLPPFIKPYIPFVLYSQIWLVLHNYVLTYVTNDFICENKKLGRYLNFYF